MQKRKGQCKISLDSYYLFVCPLFCPRQNSEATLNLSMWNKTSVILMMFSRWDVWNSIKELSVINLVLADQMFISLPIIYISVLDHSFLGKQRISILLSPEVTQGFSPLFFLTVILMYLLMCCCWLSQHSHRGVDVILFFCFLLAERRKKAIYSHYDVIARSIPH